MLTGSELTMATPPPAMVHQLRSESAAVRDDASQVAALDLAFQAAVKRNDADAMDRILHPQYALVLGTGAVISREALLAEALFGDYIYEIQDEDPGTQVVRVWGDTAVVTARLRIKGTHRSTPFDRTLWFSDTYVRTDQGWRYAFAQASLALADPPSTDAWPRGA